MFVQKLSSLENCKSQAEEAIGNVQQRHQIQIQGWLGGIRSFLEDRIWKLSLEKGVIIAQTNKDK